MAVVELGRAFLVDGSGRSAGRGTVGEGRSLVV
jgi:hypothetical protein